MTKWYTQAEIHAETRSDVAAELTRQIAAYDGSAEEPGRFCAD